MAISTINVGSSANKGDGDPLRTAFTKINDNFTDVNTRLVALEDGSISTSVIGDLKGSVFADDSTLMVDHINNELLSNKLKTNIIEADDISILAPNGIFIETAQFLTLRTQSFEITNDNAGTTIEYLIFSCP